MVGLVELSFLLQFPLETMNRVLVIIGLHVKSAILQSVFGILNVGKKHIFVALFKVMRIFER